MCQLGYNVDIRVVGAINRSGQFKALLLRASNLFGVGQKHSVMTVKSLFDPYKGVCVYEGTPS